MSLEKVFQALWSDYIELNPSSKKIFDALQRRGEEVQNDHIAFRTLRHPRLGIDQFAHPFEALGYRKIRDYHFKEKKLYAWHYEHPDENAPKIFISELLLDQFSNFCQSTFCRLIESLQDADLTHPDFSYLGRRWQLSSSEYLELAQESEYAGWVSAFGFRPNHFTVLVNRLKTLKDLSEVNAFIKSLGFNLNSSGGEIKGSRAECLEQSSTLAESVNVEFSDRSLLVPACYYEFALRYPGTNGKLYTGFVAASADKIFESTDRPLHLKS